MAGTFEYETPHVHAGAAILCEYPDALVGYRLDKRRVVHFKFELPGDEAAQDCVHEAEHGNPLVPARKYDKAVLKLLQLIRDTRG